MLGKSNPRHFKWLVFEWFDILLNCKRNNSKVKYKYKKYNIYIKINIYIYLQHLFVAAFYLIKLNASWLDYCHRDTFLLHVNLKNILKKWLNQ